jgi:hypothetical protein
MWTLICASAPRRGVAFMLKAGFRLINNKRFKTFNKGSLGSRIDEERSEARNVV